MDFADAYNAYLQKHAIRGQLISEAPDPQLNTIIAIPAYNESGLTTCLDSLFHCDPPLAPAEVIILINSAQSSSREIVAANRRSYAEVREWIQQHRSPRYRAERSRAASQQLENSPDSDPQDTTNRDQAKSQQRENDQGSDQQENANRDPATSQQQENIQDSGHQESTNHGQDQSKPQEKLRFHVVLVEDLPDKHFGAGLARKLVMDEAVRRFAGRAAKEKVAGIIVSLDADTVVRRDYLRAVEDHFSCHPQASGCSISFEHPLSRQEQAHLFSKAANRPGENPTPERLSPEQHPPQKPPPETFPPEVFDAVANYELHQRYYLLAVRYTGYPYAFHTVGSCFAVQAEAYCRAGGMSRRQAGEDFYFIQKLAVQGGFTECRSTRVYPSPRPSDRVPFGTGPDISRQIGGGQLDASAKHPNDRDSYGTGPDNRPSVHSGLDASAKHSNDRDSYGTGPDNRQSVHRTGSDALAKQTDKRSTDGTGQDNRPLPPYLSYNPELFEHLRMFFELIPRLYRSGKAPATEPNGDRPAGTKREAPETNAAAAEDGDPPVETNNAAVAKGVPPVLGRYLEESGFWKELEEIRGNTASEGAFRKRFFNKFNMFRILKYLHYAEEHGIEKMEVTTAAGMMWEMLEREHGAGTPGTPTGSPTREMLLLYRKFFG